MAISYKVGTWQLYMKKAHGHTVQYIPRNMPTVFALLCFVVVIHWLIFPYPSGLLHWHCGNLTIAPVPAKQPWWIWINTSCEFIMNDYITTTKQSTTKPCAYFLGYSVYITGPEENPLGTAYVTSLRYYYLCQWLCFHHRCFYFCVWVAIIGQKGHEEPFIKLWGSGFG